MRYCQPRFRERPKLAPTRALHRLGPSQLMCLVEAPQSRRRLIFPGRHQVAVGADEVALVADLDIVVDLAQMLEPDRLALALVAPRHPPGASQCMIDRG